MRDPEAGHPSVFLPNDALWLGEDGLAIGGVNVMAHRDRTALLNGRLEALLTIALAKQLAPHSLRQIVRAIDISRDGDHVRANLYLAIAGLSRAPHAQDLSVRLRMATRLMDRGMSAEMLRSVGFETAQRANVTKYDPQQPRVPAGNGAESGRWAAASQPSASASLATAAGAIAWRAAPLLAPEIGGLALGALSILAASVGTAAVLGVLFLPSPNSVSSSGRLPGESGATYDYNEDEGLLRVKDLNGDVLAAGHKDKFGVFFDADTGAPFAREVDNAIVFDGAAIAAEKKNDDDDDPGPLPHVLPWIVGDEDQPELCPDPSADQPGSESASLRARNYQEQISRMINPQRPLPYGLAVSLLNPLTGEFVHYDECDEQTGRMVEAKGPGFEGLLSFDQG